MAETITTPRLMAAAKEFNIGKDTLVDFLIGKGFDKDELKPTAKLSEDMYRALQSEFQSDKAAKQKAVQIDLPKDDKKPSKKEEPAPAPVVEEVHVPVPEPVVLQEPTPIAPPPVSEPVKEKEPTEIVKLEAPEIEGPKILDKIDLSTIDSSTRPKKGVKKTKKAETVQEEAPTKKESKKKKEEKQVEEMPAPVAEFTPEVREEQIEEEEPVIENIKAEKIEGPKILGKIDLPVETDTRPKPDEKRKRKRIPIEKKEGGNVQGFQRGPGQQQGQGASAGQGGGGRFTVHRNTGSRPGQQGGGNRFGQGNRTGQRPAFAKREDKQIDEKEIQRKIQETQAKLSGSGGKGKGLKAKMRRERRNEMADAMEGVDDNKLQVTEFISVSELANLMDVSFAEVISKCMGLGIMVSINQRLDAEVIELVAGEFGFDVEFIDMEKQLEMEEEEDV